MPTTLVDLPRELLDQVVTYASIGLTFRLARSLSDLSLTSRCLTDSAQSLLFQSPLVASHAHAIAFVRLVRARPHIARYVHTLRVVGRSVVVRNPIVAKPSGAEGRMMDVLGDMVIDCPRLRRLELVDLLFEPGLCLQTIAALTSLSLTSTTLASFAPHAFPVLRSLSVTNTDITFLRHSLSFPSLLTLAYHNALLDTAELPVLRLAAFAHAGAHLTNLCVGRMFDPASDVEESRAPPSLRSFVRLESLTLLADSSHRAKAYFPLLDSLAALPTPTLLTFTVQTSLGYRDAQQEVAGMASELAHRLSIAPGLNGLQELRLSKVFRGWTGESEMRGLLEECERRGIGVGFVDG